jgi:alanyl-tRNA synthetase
MTADELRAVEEEVSGAILADHPVETTISTIEAAREAGAMALFGEKYGDRVRQVIVPGVSRELCGGTHVRATGEIGPFVIVSESAVAAGTRRVEALTGPSALRHIRNERDLLGRLAGRLQSGRQQVEEKLEGLLDERDRLQREIERLRDEERRAALGGTGSSGGGIEEVDGIQLLVQRVPAATVGDMRQAADLVRGKLGSGVAILAADVGGKASFLVLVTPDLVKAKRFRADELVREVAAVAGGSGGGKPDLALAGAKDVGKIDEALEHGRSVVLGVLRGT